MQFDTHARATIRSAANWGLALAVVGLVTAALGLIHAVADLFEDGLLEILMSSAWAILELVASLALARACLALRALPPNASLDEPLGALRTYFRIHSLPLFALPALLLLLPVALVATPLMRLY